MTVHHRFAEIEGHRLFYRPRPLPPGIGAERRRRADPDFPGTAVTLGIGIEVADRERCVIGEPLALPAFLTPLTEWCAASGSRCSGGTR
jgi:hypothetical protein